MISRRLVARARPATAAPLLVALLVALAAGAGSVSAQDIRITGTTTMNYVQLQSLHIDSVLASTATGTGVLRRAADGRTVQCIDPAPYCYVYGNGATESSAPAAQDLLVSAWGFGRGVRFYAHVRSRAVVGGNNDLWPQANDHFDALEAYFELDRSAFQVRAGRQYDVGGLDFTNYDGASILLRPMRTLNVEAYGGSTLETGINEPVTNGALAAVEPFAPDSRGVLFGMHAQARPVPALSLSADYERVSAANRTGLYSQRAATSGMLRGDRLSVDWTAQIDLTRDALNELRAQLLYTPTPQLTVRTFVRRHQPYFDLWTIWGAFGAVGFVEGGAGASWRSPNGALSLDGQASRRQYLNTDAEVAFAPIQSNGWNVNTSGAIRLAPRWALDAQYGADLGFGSAKSQGALRLRRDLSDGRSLAISGTAFQTADELRVSSGTVVGIGLVGGWRFTERSRLDGSVYDYRHVGAVPESGPNWSQVRANLSFSWTVGAEPGLPGQGGH